MQHVILALITIGIVRFAWVNFKRLGAVRAAGTGEGMDMTDEQRILQARYATRIILCLLALAAAPFLFTIITK